MADPKPPTRRLTALQRSPLVQLFWLFWLQRWRKSGGLIALFITTPLLVWGGRELLPGGEPKPIPVLAVTAEGSALARALEGGGVSVRLTTAAELEAEVARGRAPLGVVDGDRPRLVVNQAHPAYAAARVLVNDAIQRERGRADVAQVRHQPVKTPGRRYIDFFFPGLAAMLLMWITVPGIASGLVETRQLRLLKRFAASPMPRPYLPLAMFLSRAVFAVPLIITSIACAAWLLKLPVYDRIPVLVGFGLLSTLPFAALGVLLGSRTQSRDLIAGLINLATYPMILAGGVFFATSRLPGPIAAVTKLLPLSLVVDGMRGILLEGAAPGTLLLPSALLAAWAAIFFAWGMRLFRWT